MKIPQMLANCEIPSFQIQPVQTSDIDEFSELVAPRGFHVKNLGRATSFSVDAKMLLSDDFLMTIVHFGNVLHHSGATPDGMRTYLIPMDSNQHFFWRNLEFSHNNIGFYNLGGEIDTISKAGFKMCVISIGEQTLIRQSNNMGIDWISPINKCSDGLFTLDNSDLDKIRSMILQMFSFGTNGSELGRTNMAFQDLKNRIIDFLILDSIKILKRTNTELSNSARVFRRFNEYVDSNFDLSYCSSKLCAYTCASERSLQYIIKDFTQLTPNQYAKVLKLNMVHDRLWKGDPESLKINQVAFAYGFWDNARFAADYQLHFGELPSETLKR